MNLSQVADIADLLAALGIILTLVFLAMQIKQNTKAVQNTRWESYLDRLANSFARPMDEHVAEVLVKGNKSYIGLNETEKQIYSAWANEYMLSAALLFTYRDQSVLGSVATNTASRRLDWFFGVPGNIEWWRDKRRHPIPQAVEEMIDRWLTDRAL